MTTHRLDPTRDTVTDTWNSDATPAITVTSGDTLIVRTLDSEGYLEPIEVPGEEKPMLIGGHNGHCMAGPIAISGAKPGQFLAITLVEMVPDSWGWTAAATNDGHLNRRLGLDATQPAHLLWKIDAGRKIARNQHGFTVALAPFLGVIGLPPEAPGKHSTFPPRLPGGGNLDCKDLVAGSTLYIPITIPGAMLCIGDGHAAQGDGEVSGTAIECGMTTTMRLELLDAAPLATLHAVTPRGRVTFGLSSDLNDAMVEALSRMVDWIAADFDVRRAEALALASVTTDMRITQVANGTWGVHAVLPHGALRHE